MGCRVACYGVSWWEGLGIGLQGCVLARSGDPVARLKSWQWPVTGLMGPLGLGTKCSVFLSLHNMLSHLHVMATCPYNLLFKLLPWSWWNRGRMEQRMYPLRRNRVGFLAGG